MLSACSSGHLTVTPALPFCDLVLRTPKPIDRAYPTKLRSIGDHLRKRRLDLGLLQREVALRIGVDKTTVFNWESGAASPSFRAQPAVIRFLGYDHRPSPEATDPGRLVRRSLPPETGTQHGHPGGGGRRRPSHRPGMEAVQTPAAPPCLAGEMRGPADHQGGFGRGSRRTSPGRTAARWAGPVGNAIG